MGGNFRVLLAGLLLLPTLASAGSSKDERNVLMAEFFKHDYVHAVPDARKLAKQGDDVAAFLLGKMLLSEPSLGANNEAGNSLAQAADRGNLGAMEALANLWAFDPATGNPRPGPNAKYAVTLLKKLQNTGSPLAYSYLGNLTAAGFDGPADINRAVALLNEGLGKDDARSAFNLGFMYEQGRLGQPNYGEAERLYRMAAESGILDAKVILALMLDRNSQQGSPEAVRLLNQADEGGLSMASVQVGLWYFQGRGVPKDGNKALALFQKAAAAGNKEAHYILGDMAQTGKLGPKSPADALAHFTYAAQHGMANAWFRVGVLYESGELGHPDKAQAIAAYRKGAAMGDEESTTVLANKKDANGVPNGASIFDSGGRIPQ